MRFSRLALPLVLALAAAAPRVPDRDAPPLQAPYDTAADAHAAVDAAFTAARRDHRLVLLDFGGNWCPDCRSLAGVLAAPEVKPWADAKFVTVMVDVGRFKKNLDIPARWGVKLNAAPTVLVVTPEGKLLNGNDVTALADARSYSAQKVVDMLAGWTGP